MAIPETSSEHAPEGITALEVTISGRVQRVGYRASLQQQAQQMGVSGWCRNTPEGAVEAWLQGPRTQVEGLLSWCQYGPPLARVATVFSAPVSPDNQMVAAFQIRH